MQVDKLSLPLRVAPAAIEQRFVDQFQRHIAGIVAGEALGEIVDEAAIGAELRGVVQDLRGSRRVLAPVARDGVQIDDDLQPGGADAVDRAGHLVEQALALQKIKERFLQQRTIVLGELVAAGLDRAFLLALGASALACAGMSEAG